MITGVMAAYHFISCGIVYPQNTTLFFFQLGCRRAPWDSNAVYSAPPLLEHNGLLPVPSNCMMSFPEE